MEEKSHTKTNARRMRLLRHFGVDVEHIKSMTFVVILCSRTAVRPVQTNEDLLLRRSLTVKIQCWYSVGSPVWNFCALSHRV